MTSPGAFQNVRVAITRAETQGSAAAARFRALGALPRVFPVIAIAPPDDPAPLDEAFIHLGNYDWLLFTSANAVHSVVERLRMRGCPVEQLRAWQVGAVGTATAATLDEYGVAASLVATRQHAEGLLEMLGDVRGQRILLPQSDLARPTLADGLRAAGARVDTVTAYRTLDGPGAEDLAQALCNGELDVVTFASPSAVDASIEGLLKREISRAEIAQLFGTIVVACIGPTTAQAAQRHGLHIDVVPDEHSVEGLIDALAAFLAERKFV